MELEINKHTDILCLDGEIWKDVVGWEDIYEVSNLGRIRTKLRILMYDKGLGRGVEPKTVYPRIRKQKLNKHTGYLMVGLNGKGKAINVTVHSMVAHAFIQYYEPQGIGRGLCTNHIDGNKLNNRVDNLEVIPLEDNVRHMFRTGLSSSTKVSYKGVEYYSKAEMRRQLNISERVQKKLIESGEVIILD